MKRNMSGEKAASPCNRFQANVFNKSKCQNCFKSRELHLLSDHDQEQAKPIYASWLCLAPEGTDFDNPMQRSRKWQRRFFILYEHGCLTFALDELPSTLPQGTVNLNLCTDIADAEPRTGQRNALCIVTSEQEIFIRGDNKEIINGWSEQLAVYLLTNKQNQKKKRKVEPVNTQEPSPAKMAATDLPQPGCGRWQEEQQGRGPDVTPIWTVTADADSQGLEQNPADNTSASRSPMSRDSRVLDSSANGHADAGLNKQQAESDNIQSSAISKNQSQDRSCGSRAERIVGPEATATEWGGGGGVSSRGRSEGRTSKREPAKLQSCGAVAQLSAPPPQRRARSLDRRTSDTVMTPDLLNFKKGWLVKLDKNEQWKKYWFVLSTDTLRYYKDSVTEESSDLEGEIDLSRCYNVSEYQVQRNYGFQIHTWKAVYTVSAMTAGIRKNWIQSLMKNVHPANSPDVTSLPGHHVPHTAPEILPKPDVTQYLSSTDVLIEKDSHGKPKSVRERRREGRYRTFDWAEFRPQTRSTLENNHQKITPPCSLALGHLERGRRWEERRKRYESMLGFSLSWQEAGDKRLDRNVEALSPESQQRAEEEIEERWKQVERTVFRLDRTVPLVNEARDTMDMEKLLDSYRKRVEDLKVQLAESERRRLELEAPAGCQHQQVTQQLDPPPTSLSLLDKNKTTSDSRAESTREADTETREPLMQSTIRQDMSEQFSRDPSTCQQTHRVWLQDTDLGDFLPDSIASPLSSPLSESRHMVSKSDGLNLDGTAVNHQMQRNSEDHQVLTSSETQENNSDCNSNSVTLEEPAEGGDGLIEQHIPGDQAVVRRLSHEVELLTSQNEALNQRNQEMLNQLTEADREIERLKAELSSRYTEPHHLPEVEQQGNVRAEDLERELSLRDKELLEARTLIVALKENLTEKEALLQLNVQTEQEKTGEENNEQKADGYLLRCFEATEAKLTELERELSMSETNCRELQTQNAELKECEKVFHQRAAELEADIRRLSQELEEERIEKEHKCVSSEERNQQVIDGMVTRLEALGKFLEVIDKLDFVRKRENEQTVPAAVSQLKWEEEFWSLLHNELQVSASQTDEEKPVEVLIREVTELMTVEREILRLSRGLLAEVDSCTDEGTEGLKDLDIIMDAASVPAGGTQNIHEPSTSDSMNHLCHIEQFRTTTQMKISLLQHVATSAPDKLHLIVDRLKEVHPPEHLQFGFVHSAATEALYCCRLNQLQSKCEEELEKTKQKLLTCDSCVKLKEENTKLESRILNLEGQVSSWKDTRNVCCQTDETRLQDPHTEPQTTNKTAADTVSEEMLQKTPQTPEGEAAESSLIRLESEPNVEMKQVLELRGRVTELEELLLFTVQELTRECDEKMACVRTQHETELEKLKAAGQRGLISMEELHLKMVEELQRRHQQEVDRLLVERDRLLEEESAATATAIKAIKNAHRLELEREVQRRCQSENLEDVHRQHSEELASYQRELQALSQQVSLKCLENGHLFQALDAERKALSQCQQENQDLRTRNQELSGHLAAEITRLCSLAKQDDLPLSQGMDVYEMEITLRVKESEVQCLKQEITSLKDELQSAQRDKRSVTKKYKDTFTELSVVRAAAEREMDELRENLRLAHHALDQTSP